MLPTRETQELKPEFNLHSSISSLLLDFLGGVPALWVYLFIVHPCVLFSPALD